MTCQHFRYEVGRQLGEIVRAGKSLPFPPCFTGTGQGTTGPQTRVSSAAFPVASSRVKALA